MQETTKQQKQPDDQGLGPEDLDDQPFDINDSSATKESAPDHGMSDEELDKQPFDINERKD